METDTMKIDNTSIAMTKSKSDLLHGRVDMLILRCLSHGPMHGWAIGKRFDLLLALEEEANVRNGMHPAEPDMLRCVASEGCGRAGTRDRRQYRNVQRPGCGPPPAASLSIP